MSLVVGTFEEVAAARLARFIPGAKLVLIRCANCGYIEGEEAPPCCRKCGDDADPITVAVSIIGPDSLNDRFAALRSDALVELERKARRILLKHPNLNEFVMAMGEAFFTTADGTVSTEDRAYMKPLNDFIYEWDEFLRLTGSPMRFTAHGDKVIHW